MKIPARLQVFETPVVLTDKDRERLAPHLAGWTGLANLLLLGVNESDLMRLIILELMGKQRWKIIDRLLMRLGRVQRERLTDKIRRCLKKR